MLYAGYVALLFLLMMVGNQADLDLWGRLAIGALIHQNGAFPYHDVFSFTAPGAVWIDHEWGCGVVFYWTFVALGSAGLFWLKMAVLGLVLAAVAVVHFEPNRSEPGWSDHGPRRFLFLLAVWATYLPLVVGFLGTVRCQIVSYLLYVVFLWVLEQFRLGTRPRRIWFLPVLMVLWVNLHGGFSYGFVALGLYFVWLGWDRRIGEAKRLATVIGLCLVATLVNPYGFAFLAEVVSAWAMKRPAIEEWQSVFLHYKPGFIVLYSAWFLFWVWVGVRDWRRDWRRFPGILLLILATAWQGFLHYKLMPFFALTVTALGPRLDLTFLNRAFGTAASGTERIKPWFGRAIHVGLPGLLLAGILGVCVFQKTRFDDDFQALVSGPGMRQTYPIDAARFILANEIRGNLWCDFESGEFLLWTLYPLMRVSIDGRYEAVYPAEVTDDFLAFSHGDGDVSIPLKYGATHILISTEWTGLVEKLRATGRWTPIFDDGRFLLLARDFPRVIIDKTEPSGVVFMDYFKGDLKRFRERGVPESKSRK